MAQVTATRRRSLEELRADAADCRACPLWRRATPTVFGEGPPGAAQVLVGEQPGDREDVEGHPFVGPAGRVLDEALGRAGIDRGEVYLTNTVKHFKWRSGGGKRRIHDKPSWTEIGACLPWLEAELESVRLRVVVLRARDSESRRQQSAALVAALRVAARAAGRARTRRGESATARTA